MLQQAPDKVNDLISLLLEAANEVVEKKDENGQLQQVVIPDSESIWMQTKMVNSPTFARYILKLRDLYDLGMAAGDYMCADRAIVIQKQVIGKYKSHKYSIDAKSSETYKDPHNTQDSLVHIISKNKIVRQYDVKGERSQSFIDGILHRDSQKDAERD